MSNLLELVDPSFLAFFLIDIIKHKLEIFRRRPKVNLILPAVELIIHYFYDLFIDKHIAVDNVEHAF